MADTIEPISGVPTTEVDNVSSPGEVDAGATAEFTVPLEYRGIIDRLYAKAYLGHEADVEYHVQLEPDGGQRPINLVASATDDTVGYLIGNDQVWDFELHRTFHSGAQLRFKYVNNDGANPHHVHMLLGVDRRTPILERWL